MPHHGRQARAHGKGNGDGAEERQILQRDEDADVDSDAQCQPFPHADRVFLPYGLFARCCLFKLGILLSVDCPKLPTGKVGDKGGNPDEDDELGADEEKGEITAAQEHYPAETPWDNQLADDGYDERSEKIDEGGVCL